MKVTFINSENYLEYWDELMSATGYDFDVDDFDFYSLFEGDPDKIKIGDSEAHFVDLNYAGEKLVCYMGQYNSQVESKAMDIVSAFFQDPEDGQRAYEFELLDNTGWAAYEAEETAIAYRGGKGYFYTLWKPIAIGQKMREYQLKSGLIYGKFDPGKVDHIQAKINTDNYFKGELMKGKYIKSGEAGTIPNEGNAKTKTEK